MKKFFRNLIGCLLLYLSIHPLIVLFQISDIIMSIEKHTNTHKNIYIIYVSVIVYICLSVLIFAIYCYLCVFMGHAAWIK